MGNVSISCCRSGSPRENAPNSGRGNYRNGAQYSVNNQAYGGKLSSAKTRHEDEPDALGSTHHQSNNLQHISEREPDDSETDPSSNPFNRPIFAARSSCNKNRVNSYNNDSYSSNNSTSRKLTNTPLTSSQDHGYNSGASTNLTQYENQLNNSFENGIQKTCSIDRQHEIVPKDEIYVNKNLNDDQRLLLFDIPANDIKNFASSDDPFATTDSAADTCNQSTGNNKNDKLSRPTHRGTDDAVQSIPKSSSCSTIFIDDSTISQPNLRQTIKCVSLAIYYHIKNRTSDASVEIFDESIHPLKMPAPNTPDTQDEFYCDEDVDLSNGLDQPNQRTIYNFVKTLFKAAQLTSEYAITTLVYLERLMTYAEMDLTPKTWRRMFLGAILLSSKVWEDQAVWNVDYAQILEEISVEDINELERQFLELIQFNMNVPSSVYAKYYFHLRTLSSKNGLSDEYSLLSVGKAKNLEAMSRVQVTDWQLSPIHRKSSPTVKRHTSLEKLRINGLAQAVLM